jgi:hypothetical protein
VGCGALAYPPYTVDRSVPIWPHRDALLAYEAALGAAAELEAALAVRTGAQQHGVGDMCHWWL